MLKIANIEIEHPFVMAPIAGYTDSPFRRIARRERAGLVYTELISADALVHANKKTLTLLAHTPEERPLVIQLLGKDPDTLVKAAGIAVTLGADVIDLNLGCPAHNVVQNGAGAALLRKPELVRDIVAAMRAAIPVPLTIKTRTGWDEGSKNILQIIDIANEQKVDAVAVHLRTKAQGFKKGIDVQSLIEAVKHSAVPVIGNGDVATPREAVDMMDVSGCAGVMIGRAALGAPWIFGMTADYGETGACGMPPLRRVKDIMRDHLHYMVEFYGEEKGVKLFRKHVVHYSRGGAVSPLSNAPHGADFRSKAVTIDKAAPLLNLIDDYFDYLEKQDV